MKKYYLILKLGWQKTLQYRFNFFLRQMRGLITVFILYFLYTAIFTKESVLFGFDHTKIVTYVLLSSILFSFVFQYSMNAIADSISSGEISKLLLKPINFFWFYFFRFLSERLLNAFFAVINILLFYILIKPTLYVQTDIKQLGVFFLAVVLSIFLFSLMEMTAGLSAFWMTNAFGPRFLFIQIVEVISGRYFPIQMLPPVFSFILKILPLGYIMFFPLNIYFGLTSPSENLLSFAILLIWIVLLAKFFKFVWKRGLKVHGAYGG